MRKLLSTLESDGLNFSVIIVFDLVLVTVRKTTTLCMFPNEKHRMSKHQLSVSCRWISTGSSRGERELRDANGLLAVRALWRDLIPVTGRNWKLFFFSLCLNTINSPPIFMAASICGDDT